MRQLGSKLLAGGLSAGVVLLWWPMFFPTDSVTMWLGRGIVWTLSFELLLVALSPFELALWNTHRGERITQRVEAKRALLEHPSAKRRLGRRAALAMGALAVPVLLIVLGVSSHIPAHHSAPPQITRVTQVVRVVKPVQRVVKIRTVAEQVPAQVTYTPTAPAPRDIPRKAPAHATKPTAQKPSSTPTAPQAHTNLPSSTPTTPTDAPSAPSTPAAQPSPAPSGAAAQPAT